MTLPLSEDPDELTAAEFVAAAYQEAGQAVAEYRFGRGLIRVPCAADSDLASLRQQLTMGTHDRQLCQLADRLFPWLLVVNRLERLGGLTGAEAMEARADLWRPFLLRVDPPAAAAPAGGSAAPAALARREESRRKDLAAMLAGGEAWRRFTGAAANPCWEEARQLAGATLPPEARARALGWAASRAEATVQDDWPAVQALAAALVLDPDLDGAVAQDVIARALSGAFASGDDASPEPAWLQALRPQLARARDYAAQLEAELHALRELQRGLEILLDARPASAPGS
jgi:hypothetical protein